MRLLPKTDHVFLKTSKKGFGAIRSLFLVPARPAHAADRFTGRFLSRMPVNALRRRASFPSRIFQNCIFPNHVFQKSRASDALFRQRLCFCFSNGLFLKTSKAALPAPAQRSLLSSRSMASRHAAAMRSASCRATAPSSGNTGGSRRIVRQGFFLYRR